MSLYSLELFKKTGNIATGYSEDWKKQCTHTVLGYYDFLHIKGLENFSEVFDTSSLYGEATNYSRYAMSLFDIGETSRDDIICSLRDDSDHHRFVIVTSCVICKNIVFDSSNADVEKPHTGKALLEKTKAKLSSWLDDNSSGEEFTYQILGNLGNFDITILLASNNLGRLISLPSRLRTVYDKYLVNESGEYEERRIISYSSSFITYSMKIDLPSQQELGTIHADEATHSLNIHFSIYDPEKYGKVVSSLNDIISSLNSDRENGQTRDQPIGASFSHINGEYSIEAHFEHLFASDVVQIFRHEMMDTTAEQYNELFRSTYSLVGIKPSFCKDTHNTSPDKERRENDKRITDELLKVLREIQVPHNFSHTLDNCVHDAIALLNNDLKYYLGQQLAIMLHGVLLQVKQSWEKCMSLHDTFDREEQIDIWYENFEKFVTRCSLLLTNLHPANCLLQDSMENQDEVNAILKVFLCYQQIVEDIALVVNSREGKSPKNLPTHTFVTVGASGDFTVSALEWPLLKSEPQKSIEHDNPLLVLNFSSAESLSIRNIVEVFSHEVGHTVSVHPDGRARRNEALHKVLTNYCIQFMLLAAYNKRELRSMDGDSIISAKNSTARFISEVINKSLTPDDYNELIQSHRGAFKDTWRTLLFRMEHADNYEEGNQTALSMLSLNASFVDTLCDAANEARADIMMICICEFTLKDYLRFIQGYFSKNRRLGSRDDSELYYRLACILCVFYKKDIPELNIKITDWWRAYCGNLSPDEAFLVNKYEQELINNVALMEPYADYLLHWMSQYEENTTVSANGNGLDSMVAAEMIRLFPRLATNRAENSLSLADEIWLYVDAWYRGIRNIEKKWAQFLKTGEESRDE